MTLSFLVMGLTGCGGTTYGGSFPSASNAACAASARSGLGTVAPDYGFGPGPAYLSGQTSWYAGGQTAMLMVDSKYSGPLLVRASQLGGSRSLTITLAEENLPPEALAGDADKERQHGVAVVSAMATADGGLQLPEVTPSPYWRAWLGRLSTSGPGCFALQVDGSTFHEVIAFSVQAGSAPPG
jgi:hypothetical protein